MDTSTPLTDALSKSPSISGILAQLSDALGGSYSQGNEFSSILSESDDPSVITANVPSSTPTPTQVRTPSTTPSFSSASTLSDTSSQSSSGTLQDLTNLSATLHQVMNSLRQQSNTKNHSTTNNNASLKTDDAASITKVNQTSVFAKKSSTLIDATFGTAKSTSTTTGATTTEDLTDQSDASTTGDDTQTLADIVAELLMLTQLVVKNLQNPATAGGMASAQSSQPASDSPLSALQGQSSTATDPSGVAGQNPLLELLTLLQAAGKSLQPGDAADAQGTATSKADPTDTSNLDGTTLANEWSALLTSLEALAKNDEVLDKASGTTVTTTESLALTPADLSRELTVLDTGLKKIISSFDQAQTSSARLGGVSKDTASHVATGTSDSNETGDNVTANIAEKPLSEDASKSQLAGALNNPPSSNGTSANTPLTSTSLGASVGLGKSPSNSDAGSNSNSSTNSDTSASFAGNKTSPMMTAEGVQATGTYNFASQLSAIRATNGGTTGLPTAVDQVILQMNRSVKSGNDQMSLQLTPGDLGKITIKLDFNSDGKVQGTVVADNPKTLDMLQKDSRSLERALQDAGLRADPGSLQFSLGGQSGQNNSGQTARNDTNGSNLAESSLGTGSDTAIVDIGAISETYYVTPGGVNIRV